MSYPNFKIPILQIFACRLVVFGFVIFYLAGCATAPYKPPVISSSTPGIYHRVERGQTLWSICKIYNIDLDEVVSVNRISDATKVELGQLIFIPHRQKKEYALTDFAKFEDFIWPLRGRVVCSFGQTFNDMLNKGINIQPYKTQNVVAASKGRVVFYSGNFGSFGKTVIIEHNNGFLTVYARNSQVFVKVGDFVQRGTVIAKIDSGGSDKNAYLHFQIRKGYIPQNPYFYLSP